MSKPFSRIELQARLHAGVRTLEREVQLIHYLSNQRKILDSLPVGLLAVTTDLIICEANQVLYDLFELSESEVKGLTLECIAKRLDFQELLINVQAVILNSEKIVISNIKLGNNSKTVELQVSPVIGHYNDLKGVLITIADISEKKYLQDTMEQMRKFEAIGQLAAGVAHEINTPAQFISENLEFLKESFSELQREVDALIPEDAILADALAGINYPYLQGQLPRAIDRSLIGIQQISHIVKAMNQLSHPGSKEFSLVNLNQLLETVTTLSRNKWKYVAELICEFDPEVQQTCVVPEELHQVFLNMIVNSAHALEEKFGDTGQKGQIKIRTEQHAEKIIIAIEDNGVGIRPEYLNKIFDPFFTTKQVGKGTGQGLAISHQIIAERHKGKLLVESTLGVGTRFIIEIPFTQDLSKFKASENLVEAVNEHA
jgi:PAS domain S-box-containing protein